MRAFWERIHKSQSRAATHAPPKGLLFNAERGELDAIGERWHVQRALVSIGVMEGDETYRRRIACQLKAIIEDTIRITPANGIRVIEEAEELAEVVGLMRRQLTPQGGLESDVSLLWRSLSAIEWRVTS